MLQLQFDRLTDPGAHTLVASVRRQRGDNAALMAATSSPCTAPSRSPLTVHEH